MASENLKSFADELKKIRESKGITLQQIKLRTRIDMKYLEAIELGDFDIMPQVYMRAFIKEYAESIGLNGKETLRKYVIVREGKSGDKNAIADMEKDFENSSVEFNDASTEAPVEVPNSSNVISEPWFIPSLSAGIIIILGLIIYFSFFNGNDDLIVKEKSYEEIIEDNKERFEVVENEEVSPEVKSEDISELTLEIVALDTSWVKVNVDSDSTTDFILYPNRKKTFRGKNEFLLVIGNSGGVRLLLNSDTLNFTGTKKKAKRISISASGIKYLPLKEKKADEG